MNNVIERATQEDMQKKLADLKQAQEDMRLEQQDQNEHTRNRLDAIDEKLELLLSKCEQGSHPPSDSQSEQQNATLVRINDFLDVSKRFNIDIHNLHPIIWQVSFNIHPYFVPEILVYRALVKVGIFLIPVYLKRYLKIVLS